ncbi:hypothetical protein [Neisseria yangbaofengii]|uniref:hypothetical protein n=1 Tax=Neisseria yangbaofengii TaxID=2709396 RepID=UPI0013EBA281|nr:hypothetical protein [Neisseria yangbaofengii]
MGTSNFMFNIRLDVVSGLSYSDFDVDSYNEGMDAEDRLQPDDYERIGDIIGFCTEDFIADFKHRADEPHRNRDTAPRWRKHRIGRLLIESTTDAADDSRNGFHDRNYGGTKLAEITADALFYGHNIRMTMDIIMRHGYYDGVNIDQQINLETDFSAYRWDDWDTEDVDGMACDILREYADCRIATEAQLARHRDAVAKRLQALEKVLWQRYEELVSPYCEEYRVAARFCNGETWYEKAAA